VAIAMMRAALPNERVRRAIHAAGLTWLACCLFVGTQTMAGLSITVLTIPSIAAVLFLMAWLFVALRAIILMRHTPTGLA
jgi:hypothetical protein